MLCSDPPAVARYRELRSTVRAEEPERAAPLLRAMATDVRLDVLDMIDRAGMGHIGGDFSVTDILVTLFGAVLDVDPEHPDAPGRDRFVLSKGHSAAALYATLAHCGYFPRAELATFMAPYSDLNGHPNRRKVPGVETNTGPLGHGFPVAVGAAIGARLRGDDSRTVVVLGDGELQEGSNWEAAMTAGHQRLDRLTAIVDRNRLQQGARTEDTVGLDPLADKWTAFGWEAREVDGHDHAALRVALAPSTTGRPVAVVAHTVKGKGVSFIEDRAEWHHKVPNQDQVRAAAKELSR
ncbi:transketolase [Streptomyces millisiae]|uniref:Transketolase n=1 Tax=Streptomyces millisiae TaxID=3075542 RepID=A0ABU2LJZ4_9ACTN|nr:transketolase [Streptomyces sp. DSM 44918]MDT0317910.1 transketolase [Streptomyces sp. DSM 44918]